MVDRERTTDIRSSAYKDYMAGFLAGVAMVVAGHPFDTVKVKLQKHNAGAYGIKYNNALHCTTRILQTEGVKGLYRGATSSVIGMAFESSLMFGIYSQMKQFLQGGRQSDAPQLQGADSMLPGVERYQGPLDCALQTVKKDGITGIFRGGLATLLREATGNAVFFSVYEHIRYYVHRPLKGSVSEQSKLMEMGIGILSGGFAGIACWCAILPLDVAKTIIQTAPDKSCTRNPLSILNLIYRKGGIRGCYTGLGPTLTRAFPANAAAIVTWELTRKLLEE